MWVAPPRRMSASELQGKVVVVTGTFSRPRGELEAELVARGATLGGSITKKTQLVFAGDKAGSKLDKARELGLTVRGEAELLALLGVSAGPAPTPPPRGVAGTTRLADFRERLLARIAELKAHEGVKVLYEVVGDPVAPEAVDAAAARRAVTLSAEERELYARMNGCTLVWVPVHAAAYDKAIHKPKKGRPPMTVLENLDTDAFRIIAMPPIEEVFGKPFDYARFLDGDPTPRLGFDFPGIFTTPALVVREGRIAVEVGDDHGAAWSAPATSLEDYVETVLATWGDVPLRRQIFLERKHGVGRAYFDAHPVALATLLPPPPPKSAAEENKLLRLLNRTYGASLSDAQLADAAHAVGSTNAQLVEAATMRLSEQPLRTRAHASTLARAIASAAPDAQVKITRLFDTVGDVALSEGERVLVFRHGGYAWTERGRIAAVAGRAAIPAIAEVLRDATLEMERARAAFGADPNAQNAFLRAEWDVKAAAHAALLLGDEAKELLPALVSHVGPPDFEARTRWGWEAAVTTSLAAALAVVAIDPSRAEALLEHLRIFIRSDYPSLALARPGFESLHVSVSELLPALRRLPEAIAARLAQELVAGESTDDVAFPRHRMRPRLALLSGLGRAGVDAAFALLEQSRPAGFEWWPLHEAIFGRALAHAVLTPEDRARAIGLVKAVVVRSIAAKSVDPTYVGYLCRLGGIDACAPELGRKKVLALLLSEASVGLGLPQIRDVQLARFLFELLRAEGADTEALRRCAQKMASSSPAFDWLGAVAA